MASNERFLWEPGVTTGPLVVYNWGSSGRGRALDTPAALMPCGEHKGQRSLANTWKTHSHTGDKSNTRSIKRKQGERKGRTIMHVHKARRLLEAVTPKTNLSLLAARSTRRRRSPCPVGGVTTLRCPSPLTHSFTSHSLGD